MHAVIMCLPTAVTHTPASNSPESEDAVLAVLHLSTGCVQSFTHEVPAVALSSR